MRSNAAPLDRRVAGIAARQHGVVSTAQLKSAGLDSTAILRRVRRGLLHRVHPGVYAVGHSCLGIDGRWMAAVLACGRRAVLSHRSAAQLWGLLAVTSQPVEVSIPGGGGRKRLPGVQRHRSRTLTDEAIVRHRGIPVTIPARTIADLQRVLPAKQLRAAVRQASVVGLDLPEEVEADFTRSELEHRFLRLCRRHRLPEPAINAPVGRFTVDFLWRNRRVIVETDGYRYHRGKQAFEDDRARDLELRTMGYEVVRISFRQLVDDPGAVGIALKILLARGGAAKASHAHRSRTANAQR
jgi:very-short-patch-repair endonuclease